MPSLDDKVAALAARYRPLAARILKEAIRIPADYVDKPVEEGGDPLCGLSNHEGRAWSTSSAPWPRWARCGGPRTWPSTPTATSSGPCRTRGTASPLATSASSTWMGTSTRCGPARAVAREDGRRHRCLRRTGRPARVDRTALRGLLGYLPPTSSGSTCSSAAVRPTSWRASSPDRGHQDPARAPARGRAAGRDRPLVRHRGRGGQRRRRAALPDGACCQALRPSWFPTS